LVQDINAKVLSQKQKKNLQTLALMGSRYHRCTCLVHTKQKHQSKQKYHHGIVIDAQAKDNTVTVPSSRKAKRDISKGAANVKADPDVSTQDDDDDDEEGQRGMSTQQDDRCWSEQQVMKQDKPRSLPPTSIQVKKSSNSHVKSSTPAGLSSLFLHHCGGSNAYCQEYGFILKHTKFRGADQNWWLEMRRVVVKAHTG
jgi:hypothetical protein